MILYGAGIMYIDTEYHVACIGQVPCIYTPNIMIMYRPSIMYIDTEYHVSCIGRVSFLTPMNLMPPS